MDTPGCYSGCNALYTRLGLSQPSPIRTAPFPTCLSTRGPLVSQGECFRVSGTQRAVGKRAQLIHRLTPWGTGDNNPRHTVMHNHVALLRPQGHEWEKRGELSTGCSQHAAWLG